MKNRILWGVLSLLLIVTPLVGSQNAPRKAVVFVNSSATTNNTDADALITEINTAAGYPNDTGTTTYAERQNLSGNNRAVPILPGAETLLSATSRNKVQQTTTLSILQAANFVGWTKVFEDLFDGSSVDTTKWSHCQRWGTCATTGAATVTGRSNPNNGEQSWSVDANVVIEGGKAKLRTKLETVNPTVGETYPYTVGMLSSHGKFEFTYGYCEAVLKHPPGFGMWTTFWLQNGDAPGSGQWPPEIDVSEQLGRYPTRTYLGHHWGTSPNQQAANLAVNSLSATSDYHTYAFHWTSTFIRYYIDNVQVWERTSNIPDLPLHLIFDASVGSGTQWAGGPGNEGPGDPVATFPNDFEIVRVTCWQES